MAAQALKDIVKRSSVKKLLLAIRSIVYPIKDNLRTLDDDIVVKTIKFTQSICLKKDKGKKKNADALAESFVEHFHIILPMFEIV